MPGPWEKYGGAPQAPAQPVGDMIVKPAAQPKPVDPLVQEGRSLDNEIKRQKLAQGPEGGKPSATELDLAAKAEGTRKRALTIRQAMREVAGLYEADIKGQPASRLFGLTEYMDTLPKNDRFRAAGNAILPLIRPLVAQTAREGDSDKEMQVFMAYVPSNDDSDIAIEQKMKMLDALVSGMAEGKPPSAILDEQNTLGAEEVTRALEAGKSRDEILALAQARGISVDEAALDANIASRDAGGATSRAVPADIEAIMAKYGAN